MRSNLYHLVHIVTSESAEGVVLTSRGMQDDCYSLSSYDQWIQYLSRYDNDTNSLPAPSSTSPSCSNPFKSIQNDYSQFLQSYPFSIHSWIKYLQLAQKHQQIELITVIYQQATQAVPYSAFLWYSRLSALLNQNQTATTTLELIDTALSATQYLTGHPDAAEAWRLIFYLLPLHGTLLQLLYCYWRALSQPSPYFSLLCDLFQQFQTHTHLHLSSSSPASTLTSLPSHLLPSDSELPLVSLFLSGIERSLQMKESRAQAYLLQCLPYERDLTQKYFEAGRRVASFELSSWHQYLSAEELLCEAPLTDSLPLPSLPSSPVLSVLPVSSALSLSSVAAAEEACLTRERDCLSLCHPKQLTEASIVERLSERRRYDRVIQLYERCLLVCPSHSGDSPLCPVLTSLPFSSCPTTPSQRSGRGTSPGPSGSHTALLQRLPLKFPIAISKELSASVTEPSAPP
jgi:hypothetical protein